MCSSLWHYCCCKGSDALAGNTEPDPGAGLAVLGCRTGSGAADDAAATEGCVPPNAATRKVQEGDAVRTIDEESPRLVLDAAGDSVVEDPVALDGDDALTSCSGPPG